MGLTSPLIVGSQPFERSSCGLGKSSALMSVADGAKQVAIGMFMSPLRESAKASERSLLMDGKAKWDMADF